MGIIYSQSLNTLVLQSQSTVRPSRRLRRTPMARLSEMLKILGGPGRLRIFYLHAGVIPVGPVVPGLISVSSRVKTSRKTPVFPGCFRCPPGVQCIPGGPRYIDASRSHPGPTGAAGVYYSHSLNMGCIFTYLIHRPISTSTLRQVNIRVH